MRSRATCSPATSNNFPGDLLGDGYTERLDETKSNFTAAKETFDRSVQIETFKSVLNIGKYRFPYD